MTTSPNGGPPPQDIRSKSLWLDQLAEPLPPRAALVSDVQVDVAFVGGGFTGLWTAYYLNQLDPSLRICVLEREVCGFGASGRNGGWAVGELAGSLESYAERDSMDAALRQLRAMFDAVDEIGRVAEREEIACGYVKGGTVRWARNGAQAERQRVEVEHHRSLGVTDDELRLLSAGDAREIGNATDVRGGVFLAASAALDPARLVRGIASVVAQRGVAVYEQTEVTALEANRVQTAGGTVSADVIIRATEAYTRDLPGERRTLIPFYSLMVATEPLDQSVFDEIGLSTRPTFADDRYMVIYGQRTEDNRIAFGGRAMPYAFGSRIDIRLENRARSHDHITNTLRELFPALTDARITHRWGGVLGVPRNWTPAVRFDQRSGFGTAGGYVGEGVAAANLAGRTLADLIVGNATDRTALPWVGNTSRRWEPEPLRWSGVRGSIALLGLADRIENRTDREARWATKLVNVLQG
jgi:glycine/D-amino acid oxidase-like deaminating enzyme